MYSVDGNDKSQALCTVVVAEEELDEVTPMQQIQKKRSRWRTKQSEDLEDTWGSLNLFNKSHRGRLSLDMAGNLALRVFFFSFFSCGLVVYWCTC